MKTDTPSGVSVYDSLSLVNRNFEQILQELDRIQKLDWFRKRAPIKSVELAVREMHAWTMFEILEVLRERAEGEWTRFDRMRNRREADSSAPRRRSSSK